MKILVLTPTFLPMVGGAELVLWEVFRRLSKDHAVLLLTPRLPQSLLEPYAGAADAYRVTFAVSRYKDAWSLMHVRGHKLLRGLIPPFSLSAVAAARRAIAEFKPDVLNVHYTMPTGLAAVVAQGFLGVPAVLTLNGRDVPGPGVPMLWKYWHRLAGRCCSEITYVSEYCRKAAFGPGGPGTVTWNGVDMQAVSQGDGLRARKALGFTGEEKVLFTLQRLATEKRVDVLIHSLPAVLERFPDVKLVVGGTGPESDALRRLAESLGLSEKVVFTGFIPEGRLHDYFALCDLFVFNSTFETFGLVLAQAMAHGKAVVSVNTTAIPDVVIDGSCGVLVKEGEPRQFADAMIELLGAPEQCRRLGEAGRVRARELFSWDAVAERYEQVFEQVLKKHRGKRHNTADASQDRG